MERVCGMGDRHAAMFQRVGHSLLSDARSASLHAAFVPAEKRRRWTPSSDVVGLRDESQQCERIARPEFSLQGQRRTHDVVLLVSLVVRESCRNLLIRASDLAHAGGCSRPLRDGHPPKSCCGARSPTRLAQKSSVGRALLRWSSELHSLLAAARVSSCSSICGRTTLLLPRDTRNESTGGIPRSLHVCAESWKTLRAAELREGRFFRGVF